MSLMVALPLLISWFLAPVIVWKIGQPNKIKKNPVNAQQAIYLRKLARKYGASLNVCRCRRQLVAT
ncbi:MAG: hypothetical protein WDM71_06985 [Ferruginibacter sp.]